MRQAKARIANERGKPAKPTRATVIPSGDVNPIPTAAAARTGSERYLKLIRVKITVRTIRGARRRKAATR